MSTKEQAHQQVIDILAGNNGEVDYRDIVINLAKQYPEVLVAIINNKPVELDTGTPEWVKVITNNIHSGDIVTGIKNLRVVTGLSLLQAKNVIRGLETYINAGYFEFEYEQTFSNMFGEQRKQVKMLQDYIKVN